MNPNFPPPQPEPNSSSLAYLNDLPPGTQPHYRPARAVSPIRLGNRPAPDRMLPNPQQELMGIDMGEGHDSPARDTLPDNAPGHGLKRGCPDTSDTEMLEHSEPVCKQRRTEPPEQAGERPVAAPVLLSPAGENLNVLQTPDIKGSTCRQTNTVDRAGALQAAIDGNLGILKYLVAQGWNIQQKDKDGMNALMYAAKNGHPGIVKYLVDHGLDYYQTNKKELDAFMLAVIEGHLDVVKCLVEKGYGIRRIVTFSDKNLLMLAAKYGHLEIVKYLHKKGCDLHANNVKHKSALMLAAKYGHLNLAQYIVGKYGDPDEENSGGMSPFLEAATYGRLDILKYFVEEGSDIHQENGNGETAIMIAATQGHLDAVKYLIDKGGNINQVSSLGYNPLSDVIAHQVNLDLVEALIELGATPNTNDVNTHGLLFSALHCDDPRLLDLLIPLHDLSKRDSDGLTPLMLAAKKNLLKMAASLIQATAKLPNAPELVEEALVVATGPFFKELLRNPSIVEQHGPKLNSTLQVDGEALILSTFIHERVLSQFEELQRLHTRLGSDKSITPMQIKSAKVSVLAELTAWKLHHPDEIIFNEDLPPSLLPVREKAIAFINKDIKVLAMQAHRWEEDHLIPVIENLYECCLSHTFSEQSPVDIIDELTSKGLYHPIAQRIATAWENTWKNVHRHAIPMVQTALATHIDSWHHDDMPDPELLTREVVVNSDTVARNIKHFADTPAGSTLLQAFRAALRDEFDSVESRVLRVGGANLSERSKALYADLVARQLHLIAQFWRAES